MLHNLMRASAALACVMSTAVVAQTGVDVSGVWQIEGTIKDLRTESGQTPPLKPEAAKIYAANMAKFKTGDLSFDPTAHCVSPGMPRILTLPYPFQIIQRPDKVLYVFQWNYWNRRIDLTGKDQDVPYPLSLGVSNGRIEGDQLVVDVKGLRADNTWLDAAGMPRSEDMVIEERMKLLGGGRVLENRITITDPGVFTKPWSTVLRFVRQPAGTQISEDVCLDRVDAKQPAVAWPK